ncbi:MAG: hypothetical protein EOP54_19185 [Sphingobacteriales bacterium]|nr:MAG: hypothetical protein EOP54_19185 [Sphingobacteriales bacterium]
MKKKIFTAACFMLSAAILFTSCEDDEAGVRGPIFDVPTNQEFADLRTTAYNNIKQEFTIDVSQPYTSFTSQKGVLVTLYTGCITKNGAAVTGDIDIEFVEIFDRGTMLATNKTTMGLTDTGAQRLLISGGEFYINATQGGVQLQTNCGIQLTVPCALTGGLDEDMLPWEGVVDAAGNVTWEQLFNDFWGGEGQDGVPFYYAYLDDFGWFNCDKFANFTGPMTDVEIQIPAGYTSLNSTIFIAIEGEPNTLGNLSGEYPVGLECYLIFVSSDGNGGWVYAIKSVTLTQDASYTFTAEELDTATYEEVVAFINALP